MKKPKNKIIKHITRGWDEYSGDIPKRLKILPPFFYEILAYLLAIAILISIIRAYL